MLCPLGHHPIADVWETGLSHKIVQCLVAHGVAWSSIDVVRIGYEDEDESSRPAIVWIGVQPPLIPILEGTVIAQSCHQVLMDHQILDVHVELRLSTVSKSKGPKFVKRHRTEGILGQLQRPFTATLGFPIANKNTPSTEGTGGLFIKEGGPMGRLLLLTARHVALPEHAFENTLYDHEPGASRQKIVIFGEQAFKDACKRISERIEGYPIEADYLQDVLDSFKDEKDPSLQAE